MPISLSDFKKIKKKRSKYNAMQIVKDQIRFDSKLEARYYDYLLREKERGEVLYFLRQVPFFLAPKLKYLVDFQIFMKNGTVRYIDVKGVMTDVSRNKIKMVLQLYPIDIEIITKHEIKNLI